MKTLTAFLSLIEKTDLQGWCTRQHMHKINPQPIVPFGYNNGEGFAMPSNHPNLSPPTIKSDNRGNGLDSPTLGPHTRSTTRNTEAAVVNVRKLNIALDCIESHIQNYLIDGFTNGFTTGYQPDGTICCKMHALPSAVK